MTPGKSSSEYSAAKLGGAAIFTTALTALLNSGIIGPDQELTWPIAAILITSLISGSIIIAAYSISRGLAKTEYRVKSDPKD